MPKFRELKVVDNFYQNNLFFPMPTVMISTLCDDGTVVCWPRRDSECTIAQMSEN